jgi:hypothetical protein
MFLRISVYPVVIAFLAGCFYSCKKITARKVEGTYKGFIRNYHVEPGVNIDDTTYTKFPVERNKRYIEIGSFSVHEDSLQDGEYSEETSYGAGSLNYIEVKDDSIVVYLVYLYQFGYVHFTEYRGVKIKG